METLTKKQILKRINFYIRKAQKERKEMDWMMYKLSKRYAHYWTEVYRRDFIIKELLLETVIRM